MRPFKSSQEVPTHSPEEKEMPGNPSDREELQGKPGCSKIQLVRKVSQPLPTGQPDNNSHDTPEGERDLVDMAMLTRREKAINPGNFRLSLHLILSLQQTYKKPMPSLKRGERKRRIMQGRKSSST